jgi:pantetheine-phosphate adenylyltransferase
MKKRIALFPGSFDPFTKGHLDIAIRSAEIFDEVVIGIGNNLNKSRFYPVEKMVEQINTLFGDQPHIRAESYTGLTAKFAENIGAKFLVRGLRNTTDFEYENSIAQANRSVFNDLETVLIITTPKYAHIRSTIIRELLKFGQDVSDFLPYEIDQAAVENYRLR